MTVFFSDLSRALGHDILSMGVMGMGVRGFIDLLNLNIFRLCSIYIIELFNFI